MSTGGGFCELHGPFDPPHTSCPYCTIENAQRQVFGPPEATRPAAQVQAGSDPATTSVPVDDGDFVRHTVEPDAPENSGATEIAPREEALLDVLEREDSGGISVQQPLGWLVVKEPRDQRGMVLAVQPNQVIGRQGDIVWDDPRVSRQHARLTLEPVNDATDHAADGTPDTTDQDRVMFHIWPFGPTNPVYVNGAAIRGATPLYENDEITLGTTVFVFKVLID